MNKYNWSKLNTLQLGRYAEYFVKMEFTLHGFDVYQSEVDDKGIDFVIRKEQNRYFDIQVKSVRNFNYIFFRKQNFELRENLFAAIVLFFENELPNLFLIPSTVWKNPNSIFISRDYGAPLKSKPEWGINITPKKYTQFQDYSFDKVIGSL